MSHSTNVSSNSIQHDSNVVPVNIFSNSPPNDNFSKSVQFISEVFSSLPSSVAIISSSIPPITEGTSIVSSPVNGTISSFAEGTSIVSSPVSGNVFSSIPIITEDTSTVFSPVSTIISSATLSITNTTPVILSVTTAPAEIGFSPGNPGLATHETNNNVQGERFLAYDLSPSHGTSAPVQDALFLPQEANGLPPSVRGPICPPRVKPVPPLQADPARVSEPATVTSPVMAPMRPQVLPAHSPRLVSEMRMDQ
jgi:hypothetical protein